MTERRVPTKEEVDSYLRDRRNWDRWGDKGSAGAINLITAEKRLSAVQLAKKGRTVSLSRPFPVTPSIENPRPALHYLFTIDRQEGWGSAQDFYGVSYHGTATTHIDALCHVWMGDGMWDGRDHTKELTFTGARYGSVDAWSQGILTRGVLLDVPKHRNKPYVTLEEPVHGWELEDILWETGITLEPGDAVAVYSGREAYAEAHWKLGWRRGSCGPARLLLALHTGPRHRHPGVGHDGRRSQRIRNSPHRPRRHPRLWRCPPGQRPPPTPGGGVRRRGHIRVHANDKPPGGCRRNGLAGESHRCVLAKAGYPRVGSNKSRDSKVLNCSSCAQSLK